MQRMRELHPVSTKTAVIVTRSPGAGIELWSPTNKQRLKEIFDAFAEEGQLQAEK